MNAPEPDVYLVERVRTALAHDPRVAELGVAVRVNGDAVFLTGDVATPERKAVVGQVVEALIKGRTLHNALTVAALAEAEADAEETLP